MTRVLSVKSVLDIVANIDLVDDLVSVFLQGGGKNHDFVVLSHSLDELNAARSHKEKAIVLVLKEQETTEIRL